jgi:hypothetical protein
MTIDHEDHLAVFVVHHIIFDGWSSRILARDLAECYRAELVGDEPDLPPLPVTYGQYATWQAQHEESDQSPDLCYWRGQLADVTSFGLREDFARPAVPTLRGGREIFTLDPEVFAALAGITRRRRATPYVGFLAALAVLLFRYSGIGDVVIGTPTLGRPGPEYAEVIGLFVESVVMRIQVRPEDSFLAVIDRARGIVLDALDHATVPLDLLVQRLKLARDLSRNPLFQICFNYLDETVTEQYQLAGLVAEMTDLPVGAAHFDLSFSIIKQAAALNFAIDFSTDLYRPQTIRHYGESFTTLLTQVIHEPQARVADLDMMSAARRWEVIELGRFDW